MWGVDAGIQRLGSGSFAVVVRGTLKGNDGEEGQEVAVKIMMKRGQLSEIHAADEATGSLVFNQLQGARTLPILGGGSTTLAALNRALTACCCLLDCFGWMLNIFKNNSPPAALCTASSICSGCFKCNTQETLSKAFSSIPALSAALCSNGLTGIGRCSWIPHVRRRGGLRFEKLPFVSCSMYARRYSSFMEPAGSTGTCTRPTSWWSKILVARC